MSEVRILIVEDEGIEAMDIQHRLASLGYPSAEIVFSGEEAVQKVIETPPDLVLMDIMLPGEIDGVTAAEQIRSRFDIPVIYLTAYADEATLHRAKITEPYGYLVKPFKERELHITIDMALYKHRMEKKLRESERWLATTLRSIGDAVIAADQDGFITFMNPVAEALTAWNMEEARHRKLTDVFRIINRDTLGPIENPVNKVLREGRIVGLANHTRLISREGKEIPIDDSAAPIKDDQGNITGVILVFRDVTERERADEQVKTERAKLKSILDTMNDGIYLVGRKYDLEYANPSIEKEFGPYLGKKCYEYLLAGDRPCSWCQFERVLAGQSVRWEWTDPRTQKVHDCIDAPLRNTDGSLSKLKIRRDITQRKRMEQELWEEKNFSNTAIESLPGIFYLFDSEGRFLKWNKNFELVSGYTSEELSGMHPLDFFVGEDQRLIEERIQEVFFQGESSAEAEFTSKDGRKTPHFFTGRVTSIGPIQCLIGVGLDITERKRFEQALRKAKDDLEVRVLERTASLKRQAELLDLAHDAIIVSDLNGVITFWNQGATEMYGWSNEEALGKIMRDLLETQFPLARKEIMAQAMEKGRWEGELNQIRKDGKKIHVFSRWALQRGGEGKPTGVMQIDDDITQRLKLEAQLRHSEKVQAMGTLAGGIAHDFNNILATIGINAELALLELPAGCGTRDNLDLIFKAGQRGRDLVRQILLFSRRAEKKQDFFALRPILEETFKLLRSSLPTTIDMKLFLETDSGMIYGDPSQIQQVIMNLCTNAAYAMRGKMGSLDISLQGITFGSKDLPDTDMKPGEYHIISVKDTGSGMDETVRKRIFEPFFTTKPLGEGTGLGLSVVHGIVKSHKGGITVYSELARGSIFRVYLPKVDTNASLPVEGMEPILGGTERILFVDDEEILMNSVRNLLQRLGYQVTALSDSQKALELFSAEPSRFDLVMTDQTMPFMTGEGLGKELLRIRPDVPIILCTGYADLMTSEKSMDMGFQGFIVKPFSIREVSKLIRHVLERKSPV